MYSRQQIDIMKIRACRKESGTDKKIKLRSIEQMDNL